MFKTSLLLLKFCLCVYVALIHTCISVHYIIKQLWIVYSVNMYTAKFSEFERTDLDSPAKLHTA